MKDYRFDEHGIGYKVGKTLQPYRPEFAVILSWIPEGSSVLDVGCGDGVLGQKLIQEKQCNVAGFDLDKRGVAESRRKGIRARVWDANEKFPYKSNSFDVVLCNTTIECLENPNYVIQEMFRVAKKVVIVSFPNFGFWVYRIQMLLGKFPDLSLFGHRWWETRMIKFFSIADFYELPAVKARRICKTYYINWRNRKESVASKISPNLFARACIFAFKKSREEVN